MPPHRIGVTGATGFIGQHLIRQALEMGYIVRAMVRTPEKLAGFVHDNLEIHPVGLGQILVSSMTARAPHLSDYAASKNAGENVVRHAYKGALSIIRAPAVFGPGDEATAPFMNLILKGLLPTAGGSGWRNRKLALVAVEDISHDILARGLSGKYDGRTVSPCNVGAVSWPDFGAMAARAGGRNVRVVPIPLPIIYPISAMTSVTSRLLNMGHLTLGKLREFLYEDWSSADLIQDAPPMEDRLRETLRHHMTRKH